MHRRSKVCVCRQGEARRDLDATPCCLGHLDVALWDAVFLCRASFWPSSIRANVVLAASAVSRRFLGYGILMGGTLV